MKKKEKAIDFIHEVLRRASTVTSRESRLVVAILGMAFQDAARGIPDAIAFIFDGRADMYASLIGIDQEYIRFLADKCEIRLDVSA